MMEKGTRIRLNPSGLSGVIRGNVRIPGYGPGYLVRLDEPKGSDGGYYIQIPIDLCTEEMR